MSTVVINSRNNEINSVFTNKKIVMFDKNGYPINATYDAANDSYNTKLYFDPNSSDTFKNIEINILEEKDPFIFQQYYSGTPSYDEITVDKFQLFNHYDIEYQGGDISTKILGIYKTNNDIRYFTKVLLVENTSKFKRHDKVLVSETVSGLSNNIIYEIVSITNKGLIIYTDTNNSVFNDIDLYNSNIQLIRANHISIKNYISDTYQRTIPNWSEPFFYTKVFIDRPLNIINTKNNDGVYNIQKQLEDTENKSFLLDFTGVTSSFSLSITSNIDNLSIYEGNVTFSSDYNAILIDSDSNSLFKNGANIKVENAITNNGILVVGNIPVFDIFDITTVYTEGSDSIIPSIVRTDNNIYYKCIQGYTNTLVNSISLDNTEYWALSDIIPISNSVTAELVNSRVIILDNTIELIHNKNTNLTDIQNYKQFINNYIDEISNIGLNILQLTDNIYELRSQYIGDIFDISSSQINITKKTTLNRNLLLNNLLVDEYNTDISKNGITKIIVSEIDDNRGLSININGISYQVDYDTNIYSTILNWINKFYVDLYKIGVRVFLDNSGNNDSITRTLDTICLEQLYPNVDLSLGNIDILDYYITDTSIYINRIEPTGQLSISINGINYVSTNSNTTSLSIDAWVNTNYALLSDKDIYPIKSGSNIISLYKKEFNTTIVINSVSTGVSDDDFMLGTSNLSYRVTDTKSNVGCIIASNSIINNNIDVSFIEQGFGTGQLLSINNNTFELNNREYTNIFTNRDTIILSYQGAFFEPTINNFTESGFFSLAFNSNYNIGDTIEFEYNSAILTADIVNINTNSFELIDEDNNLYTISKNNAFGYDETAINLGQTYSDVKVDTYNYQDTDSISDIINLSEYNTSLMIKDNVYSYDLNDLSKPTQISTNSTNISKAMYNEVDKLLYCIGGSTLYIYDINDLSTPVLEHTAVGASFSHISYNSNDGSVFIATSNSTLIYKVSGLVVTFSNLFNLTSIRHITFDHDNNFMYFYYENDVRRLSNNIVDNTFSISDVSVTIEYEQLVFNIFDNTTYLAASIGITYSISYMNTINQSIDSLGIVIDNEYNMCIDPYTGCIFILLDTGILYKVKNGVLISSIDIGIYGTLISNKLDSNIYILGTLNLYVYSTYSETIILSDEIPTFIGGSICELNESIIVYNNTSNIYGEIWLDNIIDITFQFSYLYEVSSLYNEYISLGGSPIYVPDNQYGGLLSVDYNPLYLAIYVDRQYRSIRYGYSNELQENIKLKAYLTEDNSEIFLYDISGNNLETGTVFSYIGDKPLSNPVLLRDENRNIELVDKSWAQKTIFDELYYYTQYEDTTINTEAEPITINIGYNSKQEGVTFNALRVDLINDTIIEYPLYESMTIVINSIDVELGGQNIIISEYNNTTNIYKIELSSTSSDTFDYLVDYNSQLSKQNIRIEVGQILKFMLTTSNSINSKNDRQLFKVTYKGFKYLLVEPIDELYVEDFIASGITSVKLEIVNSTKINIDIYGQTEIEDIRYKTELDNTGKNIKIEDIYIFKNYDINEGGVDYTFLNKKRKEMLSIRHDIFNYIGSYRSLINSIKYFGYDDLVLSEYFQNNDVDSSDYLKLYKAEIDNIFDKTGKIWEYLNDNSGNYIDTKLFNLSYKVTDHDGNRLEQTYDINTAIVKLFGLKKWLEENVIPLTHRILDISSSTEFRSDTYVFNRTDTTKGLNITDRLSTLEPIITDIYVLPVNSGSVTYNTKINFVEHGTISDPVSINIRTYKTYNIWQPLISYNLNDIVTYLGKFYKSNRNGITNISPLQYSNVAPYTSGYINYNIGDTVKYKKRTYQFGYKTTNTPYIPYDSTFTCISGDSEDNFLNDLIRVYGNNESIIYISNITTTEIEQCIDIFDLIKANYTGVQYCTILDTIKTNVSTLYFNADPDTLYSQKPGSISEVHDIFDSCINMFNTIKQNYKMKYIENTPLSNVSMDNQDFILWTDISDWVEIDMTPVQNLTFYKYDNFTSPINITVDENIDPYILVETFNHNGYGGRYTYTKTVDVRFNSDAIISI